MCPIRLTIPAVLDVCAHRHHCLNCGTMVRCLSLLFRRALTESLDFAVIERFKLALFVAVRSASLAAGELSHRRNAATIVARSRSVTLSTIGRVGLIREFSSRPPWRCSRGCAWGRVHCLSSEEPLEVMPQLLTPEAMPSSAFKVAFRPSASFRST